MAFLRGDEVEVCSKQVGFVGSYYAATVINNYGNKSYAVQYKNLVTEDNSHPLIEIVSADVVRPLPPKVSATGFASLDVVDAFDNDGWWVGKVSGRQGFDYFVFFDPTSRLRPHFEWVNGKWVSKKRV